MRTQPIPLVGGAYADETRPWSQQDTLNYLPVLAEQSGTRSEAMLKTPPGLSPFVENVGAPPVRGTHNAEGKLFAVIGPTLYQISNTQVAIPIGDVPGIGRVVFDHNQISQGNEVMVVNGQAGYVYNTVTGNFGRVTDPGFPGAAVIAFIGGYIVGIEPRGRFAFNSEVANATQYNTLDRFTSEVSPDRLVSLGVSNNELLLLSETTSEFFQITANAQQPFRSKGITLDKGCAGPYVVAQADNTLYWLGHDGSFYRLEGYTPRRISKRPLEQAIRGLNWSQAFAFVWEDSGHTVIYWTFPDGRTWGFDAANGEWHRRASYGLDRWRVSSMTRWNNRWIAGDFQRGRLWEMDWDYILEGDEEFISERTLAVIHDNQNLVLIPRLEVVMDTGMPITVPRVFPTQPPSPDISGDAPDAVIGEPYSFTYTTISGEPPYHYTITGDLPTGLTFNTTTSEISGTPTELGTYPFTVTVYGVNGLSDFVSDQIFVAAFLADENWYASSIAISNGSFAKSADGINWSNPLIQAAPGTAQAYGVIISDHGKVLFCANTAGKTTDDQGATFTSQTGLGSEVIFDGVFAQEKYFISAANCNVKVSDDGIAFTVINAGTFPGQPNESIRTITGNDDLIVAAGYWPRISSDAGANWTVGSSPVFSLSFFVIDMACSDSLFIAVGQNNRISSSTNGLIWTPLVSPFAGISEITSVSFSVTGGWVIGNAAGQFAFSADGVTFTFSSETFASAINAVASSESGLFVAVGNMGNIESSTDKNTWTPRANSFGSSGITDIARSKD